MYIETNENDLLIILKAVYGEFISTGEYFKNNKNETEKIGIILPEEYKDIYNNLLTQSHDQGELLELNLIV